MPDAENQPVNFVSTATIYKSGGGHPFPPGTPVPLHPDHAKAFRAMDLEAKTASRALTAPPAQQKPDDKKD